jgi:hypothetical protein
MWCCEIYGIGLPKKKISRRHEIYEIGQNQKIIIKGNHRNESWD